MKKILFAFALYAVSAAANAVPVVLIAQNSTSGGGTIGTLINDGSQINNAAGPSTAIWDWDGTTLTSTGLYTAVSAASSSPVTASAVGDIVTDLSIDTSTSTASATAYDCFEGNFLIGFGFSGCGNYSLGDDDLDNSTTTWGPGTATSQTIGGDDVSFGGARSVSTFNFGLNGVTGTGLNLGDLVMIGNGVALGSQGTAGGGELMTFQVVPVPAAVWLFGSALGLLGWMRRKAN